MSDFSPLTASLPVEPQAKQCPIERALHGIRLIDEYAWLKADNWQQVMRNPSQLDPEIRAYLEAENDYCERALADTKNLQEKLFAEMKGRIKQADRLCLLPTALTCITRATARKDSTHCCVGRHGIACILIGCKRPF